MGLDRVRELGRREAGLAVSITIRPDGVPRASVVNAGVLDHPVTGRPIVGFVARGAARKLEDLRRRADITVVFRAGWEWVAAQGTAELFGPDDELAGISRDALPQVLRTVYASAAGGAADDWAALDEAMVAEHHTAVLISVVRLYPSAGEDSNGG